MSQGQESTSSEHTDKLTELRAEIVSKGIDALVLVNGGAATALLAFLSDTWKGDGEATRILGFVVGSLASFGAGIIPAALTFSTRYWASRAHQNRKNNEYRTWSKSTHCYWCLSASSFVIGVVIMWIAGLALIFCPGSAITEVIATSCAVFGGVFLLVTSTYTLLSWLCNLSKFGSS